MKITQDTVQHVARLARLELEPDELEEMTEQLDAILGYVDKLNELETAEIEPMSHAVPMENAFRADEPRPSLDQDQALDNAPEQEDGCFRVPKVIE